MDRVVEEYLGGGGGRQGGSGWSAWLELRGREAAAASPRAARPGTVIGVGGGGGRALVGLGIVHPREDGDGLIIKIPKWIEANMSLTHCWLERVEQNKR